jgi:thiol-disulfide isomerase/thioredoxin
MAVRIRAPELMPNRGWLNTPRPLSLAELRGQVVVLDFWTYCCINCMHVLPVLGALEARRRNDPVVVIGVHSAKFESEGDPARIEAAVRRYGVEHPVVVDFDMAIWQQYAVRSWPTLVILRPDGSVCAVAPGEPDLDALDRFVGRVLDEARADGTLAAAPFRVDAPTDAVASALRFPGKLAVAPDGRIAIADTGHNRVLVCDAQGAVLQAYGDGVPGLVDGASPRFYAPNGLCFDEDLLWVADTRNHALRRIDLAARTVSTVAGSGRMGHGELPATSDPRAVDLRSPWDVVVVHGDVLVAMAGTHQLWLYDTTLGRIAPFAGSGREALVDGALEEAAFAQPSGLAVAFPLVFVADSETSAVRVVDLARGRVRTLVGQGLFDFGRVDGPADTDVIVADTYNDALRRITPDGTVSTLHHGELREPEDVVLHEGVLLVADTNHHRIARVSTDGAFLGELVVTGAPAVTTGHPEVATPPAAGVDAGWFDVALPRHVLGAGPGTVALTLVPPDGWTLAADAPARIGVDVSRRSDLLALGPTEVPATHALLATTVAVLPADPVEAEVVVVADAVLCSGEDGRCVPVRAWFRLPIGLAGHGGATASWELPLRAPV